MRRDSEPQPVKLSKRDRRMANIQKRQAATLAAEQQVRRDRRLKTLAGVAAAGTAVTLFALGIADALSPKKPNIPTFSPEAIASNYESDNSLIQEEIQVLGIELSAREKAQFDKVQVEFFQKIPEDENQRIEATKQAIIATINAMRRPDIDPLTGEPGPEGSENPKFNAVYDLINQLSLRDELILNVAPTPPEEFNSYAGADAYVRDGRLFWLFDFNPNRILHQGPVVLALALVHEAEHIQSGVEMRQGMPDLTPEEFREKYIEKSQIDEEVLREEMRAYAAGALGFIWAKGLLQYPSEGFDFEKDAAELIRCGRDAKGACWYDYIKSDPRRWDFSDVPAN